MNQEQLLECIEHYAIEGLKTEGASHKQWYLEKIVDLACQTRECSIQGLKELGIEWEQGIAP